MDSFVAELKKIPPVTRFSVISLVGLTLPVMMKVVQGRSLIYYSPWVWKNLELWRVPTSFFLGSQNINFIFEIGMLYRMLNQIESEHFSNRSSDLAFQMLFAASSIIFITRPVKSILFLHPLLACLSYVSSALAPPGAQTSLMGFITVPVTYFPYVMVVMDLLMAGPQAAAEAIGGIIVGHLWWWGVWGSELGSEGILARYGQAPQWLRNLFGERDAPRPPTGRATGGAAAALRASGVEVVPPRRVRDSAQPTGHQWGHGNRLGT